MPARLLFCPSFWLLYYVPVSGVRRYEELRLSRRDFSRYKGRSVSGNSKSGFLWDFRCPLLLIGPACDAECGLRIWEYGFSWLYGGATKLIRFPRLSIITASALSAYVLKISQAGNNVREYGWPAIQTQCLNLMNGSVCMSHRGKCFLSDSVKRERKRITRFARRLIVEKKWKCLTVTDIVRECGITRERYLLLSF